MPTIWIIANFDSTVTALGQQSLAQKATIVRQQRTGISWNRAADCDMYLLCYQCN